MLLSIPFNKDNGLYIAFGNHDMQSGTDTKNRQSFDVNLYPDYTIM